MARVINRVGERHGKLVVQDQFIEDGRTFGKFLCDCGEEKVINLYSVTSGRQISCGCFNLRLGYGPNLTKDPEYKIYYSMLSRVTNPNNNAFVNYGERGIEVSDSWRESYLNFLSDMGPRPSSKHTIERVDVNLNYCKENCIWTEDRGLQSYNSRKRSDNRSGKTGVCWYEASQSWSVEIKKDKVKYFLGYYKDIEQAISVREEAELKYYGFIKE